MPVPTDPCLSTHRRCAQMLPASAGCGSQNSALAQEASPEQPVAGPFQTARTKLAGDMRKQGRKLVPQDLTSGSMFPQGQGAFHPGAPRTGLARPQGSGPRNPAGAADQAALSVCGPVCMLACPDWSCSAGMHALGPAGGSR